jgi:hypothetical protein
MFLFIAQELMSIRLRFRPEQHPEADRPGGAILIICVPAASFI